ncbi:MAG: redox-sensing transcriptional repressor Rex [Synergistales bacterium]|nr:redox-sensing transcriptional repressor Rex [Synergistales bacterium]
MKIAEPTVERLVQYYRLLKQLHEEGRKVVSSQDIGEILAFKASQVRKDLSYFGEIGKRGVGYHVDRLYSHIREILASPQVWHIGLVGVGHLGEALLGYNSLRSEKFNIHALFDVDESKVGGEVHGIPCYHVEEMPQRIRELEIEVVILTVPGHAAQSCVDKAAESGVIQGILSFSPTPVVAPEDVLVYSVDISVELEKLLFYLKQAQESASHD